MVRIFFNRLKTTGFFDRFFHMDAPIDCIKTWARQFMTTWFHSCFDTSSGEEKISVKSTGNLPYAPSHWPWFLMLQLYIFDRELIEQVLKVTTYVVHVVQTSDFFLQKAIDNKR